MSAAARVALLLLLAALPAAAWADPISVVAFAVSATATAGIITATTAFFVNVGLSVLGASMARRKARKAAAAQRAAGNASLQDRTVSVLRGNPPWQIVYGRAIVGGAIVDICASDKPNARKENGDTYTKADALKHLVIVLAAHECEAIHEVYIDGEPVGTLDGGGQPTGGAFYKASESDSRTVTFTTSITLPETPVAVLQAYSTTGSDIDAVHTAQTVTIGGNTLTGPAGVEVTCNYTVAAGGAMVRIGKHLGTSSQAVDSYLASVLPSRYTSAHQLKGLCYIVVTLDLEETRFQGGPPNITADVSGRKVLDTRTSTTAWSDNPALCIRDFLTAEWGYGAAAGEVDDAYLQAAADVCDEPIDLDIGGTVTAGQARYTLNGAISTDSAAEATLEDMAGAMAGVVAYGGSWQVMAGAWVPPVMDLDDDDLHGMLEVVQADTPIDQLFNGVRGQYIPAGAQTAADINPYRNATFATADGRDLWLDLQLPFTDNLARARNLARTLMEGNRAGQVLRFPATLRAWPLQVGDRVRVTSAEYGLSLKTYRVTDWQFGLDSAVQLTLQEDDASIYDLADAAVADPTPNTDLPNPWVVAAMAGVAATSGGTTLLRLSDGTIVPRVQVTWTARTDAYVLQGGRIEVLWRRPGFDGWIAQSVAGSEAEAWLVGPNEGEPILIEVRAVNSLGVRGPSAFVAHTVVGKTAAPSNVTGLAYALKPGQVVVTWDACPDVDYKATELRYGGSDWATATLLWQGAGTEYQQARPANGTYTVRAAHLDTSGNYSATPATVSVTVDDSIDPGAGESVYVEYSVDGSTSWHSTFTTGDIWARWKIGVGGTWGTPFRIVGETGDAGDYVDFIFKRAASIPATPTGATPAGWSDAPPAADGNPLWASTATKTAAGALVGVWSTPVQIEGPAGADGTRTAVVYLYRRAASTPGLPSLTVTYNFTTNTPTGMNNSWTATIPAGTDPLYVTAATATAAAGATTDTIISTEWASPVILVQDGADGADGAKAAVVRIYRRTTTSSTPSLPSLSSTYTFADGSMTGLNNSWQATVPSSGGAYLWTSQATALSTSSGDTILAAEWSAAVLMAQDGATGAAGTQGNSAARAYALYTGNPTVTGAAVVRSGTSLPLTTSWSPTSATSWTTTVQTPGTGQAMFQSDGIFDPVANQTTWGTPYLSNFKVGSLSAISADMGSITAGSINTTGYIKAEGATSITLYDPLLSSNNARTVAMAGNTAYGSQVGLVGMSDDQDKAGIYAYNANTVSPVAFQAVTESGGTTALIVSKSGGTAVQAEIRGSVYGEAVVGISPNNTGIGVRGVGMGTGTALRADGPTVLNGTVRINQTATTGAATATFPGNNKPGSGSTCSWVPININGTAGYIPFWT